MMQRTRLQHQQCPNGIVNAPVSPRMENSSVSSHQRHEGHQHCSVFQKAPAAASDPVSNENANGGIHSGQHPTVSADSRYCITHQPTQLITSWLPGLNSDCCFSDNSTYYRSYYHHPSHQNNRRHSSYKLAIETNELETKV